MAHQDTAGVTRMSGDPLAVIAATAPPADTADAAAIATRYYGLRASARELVSERDRNFHLQADDGRQFVLKITNAAEDPLVTDFQIKALLHIAAQDANVSVPVVVPTTDGRYSFEYATSQGQHVTRLVTYLDGVLMRSRPVSHALSRNFGRYAASLGRALRGFDHPGADHALLWDMRQAVRVRDLVNYIADDELRGRVADCLDSFIEQVLPHFPMLRTQIIHNDMNPENVLVDPQDDSRVVGVFDFGDMVRSPLIVDVAVAAAYMRNLDGDPLPLLAEFVAEYHRVTPLLAEEVDLVFDLTRVRLATTTAILHWRIDARGADDPYLGIATSTESTAARFLAKLDEIPRQQALATFRQVVS
ncbi:MAG TPA: phosphotransferase [Woeseiaceae bacterium]